MTSLPLDAVFVGGHVPVNCFVRPHTGEVIATSQSKALMFVKLTLPLDVFNDKDPDGNVDAIPIDHIHGMFPGMHCRLQATLDLTTSELVIYTPDSDMQLTILYRREAVNRARKLIPFACALCMDIARPIDARCEICQSRICRACHMIQSQIYTTGEEYVCTKCQSMVAFDNELDRI